MDKLSNAIEEASKKAFEKIGVEQFALAFCKLVPIKDGVAGPTGTNVYFSPHGHNGPTQFL